MQELAILLSSLAGAASAVAVKKFPRRSTRLQSMGASEHIRGQINSLKIEKDILNKTIARLYEEGAGDGNRQHLHRVQRDRLLLKYQHQLGMILARLERLEVAKRHPDLGPVGDGLITLMDQKLSQLDSRLHELSTKISTSDLRATGEGKGHLTIPAPATATPAAASREVLQKSDNPMQRLQDTFGLGRAATREERASPEDETVRVKKRPVELTTLTHIPKGAAPPRPEETARLPRPTAQPSTPTTAAYLSEEEPARLPRPTVQQQAKPARSGEDGAAVAAPPAMPSPKQPGPPKAVAAAHAAGPALEAAGPRDDPPGLPTPKVPGTQDSDPKPAAGDDAYGGKEDDDLESLKHQILTTLAKLDQAEVE